MGAQSRKTGGAARRTAGGTLLAAALAASLTIGSAAPGWAQPPEPKADPRIDQGTGRATNQWPPDQPFDMVHSRLEIDIPDMDRPELTGVATITAKAVGGTRAELPLDAAASLTIRSVSVRAGVGEDNGGKGGEGGKVVGAWRPAAYRRGERTLAITLATPAARGETVSVRIEYAGENMTKNSAGLLWIPARKEDGKAKRAPMVYSQGQADWNRYWFPCHDFPHDKLTTELVATVPEGNVVLSNGKLVSQEAVGGGRVRFHWLQDQPHSAYLVTMVVGRFDIVDVGGEQSARPGLWMPVYCEPGTGEKMAAMFRNTPAMVRHLEEYFGEPYPWAKYAQVLVRDFRWGGMENTSATTLAEGEVSGRPGDADDLIVHELCHQWMGDLVTCRSWDHLWLNEGWATLAEWLWTEHTQGRDAYLDRVQGAIREIGGRSRAPMPTGVPMVCNRYALADETFEKADNPYGKGALVLHMLRERLGEAVFRRGTKLFIERFRHGVADTDDYRRVLEEVSGQSLERFFQQWCRRTGLPRVSVDLRWDEQARMLSVTLEQTQKIDADNPAFAMRAPVWVELEGEPDGRWFWVDTDRRTAGASFRLPRQPSRVLVDPQLSNAAMIKIRTKLAGEGGER